MKDDFSAAPPRPLVLYPNLRRTASAGYDAMRRLHRLHCLHHNHSRHPPSSTGSITNQTEHALKRITLDGEPVTLHRNRRSPDRRTGSHPPHRPRQRPHCIVTDGRQTVHQDTMPLRARALRARRVPATPWYPDGRCRNFCSFSCKDALF